MVGAMSMISLVQKLKQDIGSLRSCLSVGDNWIVMINLCLVWYNESIFYVLECVLFDLIELTCFFTRIYNFEGVLVIMRAFYVSVCCFLTLHTCTHVYNLREGVYWHEKICQQRI